MPYVEYHNTTPTSMNDQGVIVGSAEADHGVHAVMWEALA
jgi:hypothetical protein